MEETPLNPHISLTGHLQRILAGGLGRLEDTERQGTRTSEKQCDRGCKRILSPGEIQTYFNLYIRFFLRKNTNPPASWMV